MKFLCVSCDEAMHLKETRGPDEGSMAVVFACPSCGQETAMLTNPMETQMVRSLGVKIGGRTTPAAPMELVHERLSGASEPPAAESVAEPTAAGPKSESKCPFTGMVTEAFERQAEDGPVWTEEAEARMARIPSYVRGMVRKSIEQHARERGYAEIDSAVVDEIRGHVGM